jgi:hypothetical protein
MAMASSVIYSLHLPLTDNAGKPFGRAELRRVHNAVARFAGGCTVLPPGDGLWTSPCGVTYRDQIEVIQAVVPATADTEQFFGAMAAELAQRLGQEVLFIHRVPVVIVAAPATELTAA